MRDYTTLFWWHLNFSKCVHLPTFVRRIACHGQHQSSGLCFLVSHLLGNSSWEKVIRKSKSLEKAKGRRGPGVSDVGELIGKNSQIQSEDVIYDISIYIYILEYLYTCMNICYIEMVAQRRTTPASCI